MEKSSKTETSLTFFFSLFFLSLLLFFSHNLSLWKNFQDKFETLVNPAKFEFTKISRFFSFAGKSSVGESGVILQAKIDYLLAENARIKIENEGLFLENEALKKQQGINLPQNKKLLPVRVLAVLSGVMTVDKGEDEGVKEGMIVVSGDILIGRISQVNKISSRVQLPSREDSKIDVLVLASGEEGILQGTAENRVLLQNILQKVDLKEDQIIITSGKSGDYPAGLPVAKIKEIIKDDVAIYQKAEVVPLIDYSQLDVVMVRL